MAKVRLADIAERAGVSTVTVHNALSGQKGVSDELRRKIIGLAKEMGYRKNAAVGRESGRGLKNIGILISEKYLAEYTTFYWKMYQEMALVAADKNCMTSVEILKHEAEDTLMLPRVVEENTVEGLRWLTWGPSGQSAASWTATAVSGRLSGSTASNCRKLLSVTATWWRES